LPVLLSFLDSATGEAVITELRQRLRNSERALDAHKERHDLAALESEDALEKHQLEERAHERASGRLSVAILHAQKRLAEAHLAERQQAGANARAAALGLAGEAGDLLRGLLDQAKAIAVTLARWSAVREEVDRLNDTARAGGAELVAMPELPDDAEGPAEKGAEAAADLGEFLTDQSRLVWSRKQRARRAAEADAKRLAEMPSEEEVRALRASGFDADILKREPRNADDLYQQTMVRQELWGMRRKAANDERLARIATADEKKMMEAPPRAGAYSLTA
jgi:hypothetical protein